MQKGIGLRVFRLCEFERCLREFDGTEIARRQAMANLIDAEGGEARRLHTHRSITLGTLKYPAPASGALASAASFPSGGRSRSSRNVAVSSASYRTCAIG